MPHDSNKNGKQSVSIKESGHRIREGCDVYIPKGYVIADKANFPQLEEYKNYIEMNKEKLDLKNFSPCFYFKDKSTGCVFVLDDGVSIGTAFRMCKKNGDFDIEFEE